MTWRWRARCSSKRRAGVEASPTAPVGPLAAAAWLGSSSWRRPHGMIRVGSGLDVHAFADGLPLRLGGILIPHPRGLAGHSDGDAAIHALTDALLGAAGRGDIGEWFPSSDARWRGASSLLLLQHVWTRLKADGWRLENADLTVVAAEPKLSSYREQMRSAIAETLGCGMQRISIKATTTDGLGALGRGEGILASAVALLARD